MNRVELTGRVVRDDFRYTKAGYPMMQITLAVYSEPRFDRESGKALAESNFVAVTFWGKYGEALAEEGFREGEMMYVLGEVSQSEWTDADTGRKESKTRVKGVLAHRLEPAVELIGVDI